MHDMENKHIATTPTPAPAIIVIKLAKANKTLATLSTVLTTFSRADAVLAFCNWLLTIPKTTALNVKTPPTKVINDFIVSASIFMLTHITKSATYIRPHHLNNYLPEFKRNLFSTSFSGVGGFLVVWQASQ